MLLNLNSVIQGVMPWQHIIVVSKGVSYVELKGPDDLFRKQKIACTGPCLSINVSRVLKLQKKEKTEIFSQWQKTSIFLCCR